MTRHFTLSCLVVLATLATLGTGAPAHASDRLHLSGFGTAGLLWLDTDDFFFNHPAKTRERADRPDFDSDTRLGVQALLSLDDRTGVTVQMLSSGTHLRPFLPRTSWAFVHHRPTPGLMIRAGRLRTPFFMNSDSMDVGFAHPWVRPPVEVYGLNPFDAMDGIDMLYTRRTRYADLEFQPYLGYKAKHAFPDGKVDLTRIVGARVRLERDRFSAHLGYGQGKLAIRYGDPLFSLVASQAPTGTFSGRDAQASFTSAGFEWDDGRFQLIGEYARRRVERYIADADAWHLTAIYRVGTVSPYLTVARQRQVKGSAPRNPAIFGIDAYLASRNNAQRSITLGARWDLHPKLALKGEWSRARVDRNSWGAYFPRDTSAMTTPAGAHIDMLSLSLDFVF